MKKLISLTGKYLTGVAVAAIVVIGGFASAHATDISCNYTNPPSPSILVSSLVTVTCGPVVFSNFQIINSTDPNPILLNSAVMSGGVIDLNFNPNFSLPTGGNQDFVLLYQATVSQGVVVSIDGSIGGSGGTMTENLCSVAFSGTSCGGTLLAQVTVHSGTSPQPVINNLLIPTGGSLYILKDVGINCPSQPNGPGCAVSVFGQSWHIVPEPTSMVLFGMGLVGLAAWGRKRLGKK